MADTNKKTEVPVCACGKVNLYEERVKQNEKDKVSPDANPSDKDINSPDDAGQQYPKAAQNGK